MQQQSLLPKIFDKQDHLGQVCCTVQKFSSVCSYRDMVRPNMGHRRTGRSSDHGIAQSLAASETPTTTVPVIDADVTAKSFALTVCPVAGFLEPATGFALILHNKDITLLTTSLSREGGELITC